MPSPRFVVRALLRARAFTSASVGTIVVCTAAACSVFALLNAVLLRPLPYPNADRLVGLWHTLPGVDIPLAKQSVGTYALYSDHARTVESLGLYLSLAATVAQPGAQSTPERVRVGYLTPSIFRVLGARALLGRTFTDADAPTAAPPVALLSERLWRERYGANRSVLGSTISIDGASRTIVGVMPASFAFPEASTPVWVPLDATHPAYLGNLGYDAIGRLRSGVTIERAQRELARILPHAAERFPEQRPGVPTAIVIQKTRIAPVIHPMRDDVIAGFDRVLWLIAGTVALLVVVAFSNVASLLLVRMESRHREFAVRRALGASTVAIWSDLVLESAIVTASGTVIGLAAASFIVQALVHAAPAGVPRLSEVHVDGAVVVVAGALMLLFASATALVGLLRMRGRDTMPFLRDAGRTATGGRSARRLRAAFVAVEVAMSLALLAGSGVLARSLVRLRAVDPGFDAANVFTVWTFLPRTTYRGSENTARFYRDAIARIRELPGVTSVAATAKLPLEVEGFPYRTTVWGDNGTSSAAELPPVVQATTTTSGYFDAMHIPLVAGRTYEDAHVRRGAYEAVASRAYVEQVWHDRTGRSGVGKRLRPTATGPWFTIVGVVGNVRDSTLTLPPVAEVYFPEEPNGDSTVNTTGRDMAFVVRTRGAAPNLPADVRRVLASLDPSLPFHRAAWMSDVVVDSRARMTFALVVLGAGAMSTLLLGIVGLYGAIAYVTSLRAREIGIRIALGLDPARAPRLLLREGAAVVGAGLAAGVLVFAAFARLLGSLTFDVRPLDPSAIASAAASVLVIATFAMWIPARRAASVNPADTLKAE